MFLACLPRQAEPCSSSGDTLMALG